MKSAGNGEGRKRAKSKKDLFLSEPDLCKKCSPAILKTIIWLLKKASPAFLKANNKVLSEDCFGFNAKDLVKSGIYKNSNAAFTEAKVHWIFYLQFALFLRLAKTIL